MTSEPKRKRGRPATGQTPPAERARTCVTRLRAIGGRRMSVNMNPDAAAAIAAIREWDQLDSDTAAISAAVIWYANKKLPKR